MAGRSDAWVFGIDNVSAAAAQAFAKPQGRNFAHAPDPEHLVEVAVQFGAQSLLLFLPRSVLTLDRVGRLAEDAHHAGLSVGIVPLPDDIGVSAAMALARRLAVPRVVTSSAPGTLLFADTAPESEPEFFRDAASDDFFERSRSGANAIVFGGHGNGACFKLGRAALCVLAGERLPGAMPEACSSAHLPCQAGGPCLQRNISVKAGPSTLNAGIVVMLTCWGWMPTDGYLDPGHAFADALLMNSEIRALVTTFAVSQSTWSHALAARDFLDLGGTAGQLCLALNAMSAPGTRVHVCIGDPDAAIAPPSSAPGADGVDDASEEAPLLEAAPASPNGTEDLKMLLRAIGSGQGLPEVVEANALADAIGMPAVGGRPTILRVAEFLSDRVANDSGAMWRHYTGGDALQLSEARAAPGRHTCGAGWWVCDTLPHPTIAVARRHWICSRCGVVGDTGVHLARLPDLARDPDGAWRIQIPRGMPRRMWLASAVERSGDVAGYAGPAIEVPDDSVHVALPRVTTDITSGIQNLFAILVSQQDFVIVRSPFTVDRHPPAMDQDPRRWR